MTTPRRELERRQLDVSAGAAEPHSIALDTRDRDGRTLEVRLDFVIQAAR